MADPNSRTGLFYGNPEIMSFVERVHAPHDEALEQAFRAPGVHGFPAIQINPLEGRMLGFLLRWIGARKVVEVGTLTGYSAIHMARALPADGHLWTIESEAEHAVVARQCIDVAGLQARCQVLEGLALDVLPQLEREGPFDAVFLDGDKGHYDVYSRWAAENLRQGGLLLADNAFYFGNLLKEDDPEAPAMRRFHREAGEFYETLCIPTPDGLLVGVRR